MRKRLIKKPVCLIPFWVISMRLQKQPLADGKLLVVQDQCWLRVAFS